MPNNWNIPAWLEKEVRARDTSCVYCGCEFLPYKESSKAAASWEQIINDITIINKENIVLCCCSCNASKGKKKLSSWLESSYCNDRGITSETVAPVVKHAILNGQ
jgi:hypothetical protein